MMKIAEEWTLNELNDESSHSDWLEFIKRIQLDAIKHGMELAAKVLDGVPHEGISPANEKVIEIRAGKFAILQASKSVKI